MPRENSWANRPRRLAPEDELGGVDAAREGQQGLRDVVADDLVVGAAHALDQGALPRQVGGIGAG